MARHTTEVLFLLVSIVLGGLIVGALGRFAIPGPNPMSIGQTILIGIGGSFIGGIVGYVLFRRGGGLILSVLGAAFLVWLVDRRRASV
jgi:uncharacterized membrane protein YeaQ/YmgE (transglycosylase-associated protein family)